MLPYPIPQFVPRLKVTAADHMEPIRLDMLDLDARLGNVDGGNPAGQRLTALETLTGNDTNGNVALGNKVTSLTTRVSGTESNITSQGSRITALENSAGNPDSGNAALAARLSTVETRTADATTGNVALGNRVKVLETKPGGEWRLSDVSQTVPFSTGAVSPPAMRFNTVVRAPVGITQNNGTFTNSIAGWWDLAAQVDMQLDVNQTYQVNATLAFTDGRTIAADVMFLPKNAWAGSVASAIAYLPANSTFDFRLYIYGGGSAGNAPPVSTARSFFRALMLSA